MADRVQLHCGNLLDVLPTLAECSIDSCVTDPPYAIRFMGRAWDGDIAARPETWAAVLRVLKPGAHLLAFGGTRTYHRMVCAIEDAGFEIRDTILWLYGSGFPKSHTALKPACELIVFARKPLAEPTIAANVLKWGTGAINIDRGRVVGEVNPSEYYFYKGDNKQSLGADQGHHRKSGSGANNSFGRWPANVIHDGSAEVLAEFPETESSTVSMRGGVAEYRKADGHRTNDNRNSENWEAYRTNSEQQIRGHSDSGSAARFFYTAKADADDRIGSKHPTIKPLDLMQYLVRLMTPKGGIVLDPFAGTGTTGEAAFRESCGAILIERETEYQDDIRRRLVLMRAGPDERAREAIKHRLKDQPIDAGPLFSGLLDG